VISDPNHPKKEAVVMKMSGTGHVLSNIAQNLGGLNSMQDAQCECSETSLRKYGMPCAHNIAHAQKAGETAESIVHWKDTTMAWKRQYAGLLYPALSTYNIDTSALLDPKLQYPPVASPAPGRPKKKTRIMGGEEASRKQQRTLAKAFCGACQTWGHTKASKHCSQYNKRKMKGGSA
jgi:hypothetical protein